jgi:peptidoglycan hydrolase CwlO-like protein
MITDLFSYGSIIDVALLLLIIFSILGGLLVQRKMKQKIEEMETKILSLEKNQEDTLQSLNRKLISLRDGFIGKIKGLTVKLNEVSKQINSILEKSEAFVLEIDNKTKPLKVSLGETERSLRKIVQESEKGIKKMEKELSDFSKEIQKMKDDIRERTIDLEI